MIEMWTRQEEAKPWQRALVIAGHAAEISALGARLDIDAVYDDATEPT